MDITCTRCGQTRAGLEKIPFPGPIGQRAQAEICTECWGLWLKQQTMLINERHLNMMDAEDRKFLMAEMEKFFAGEEFAKAEGYVPPSQ